MMKKSLTLGIVASLLLACSADDAVMEKSTIDEKEGLHQTYDIGNEDLEGTWKLVSMESNAVPVDLNLDDISSTDILSESRCFDEMSFIFGIDGKVVTQQAKLYFETSTGQMECQLGTYQAEYEVTGQELRIGFNFGGAKVYQTRYIDVLEVDGDHFLEMDLTYAEAKVYISNPDFVSPTGATNLKAVTMLFKKQ